jgi:hypothetical protein
MKHPDLGSQVHYVGSTSVDGVREKRCLSAFVTMTQGDPGDSHEVSLMVMHPVGAQFIHGIMHHEVTWTEAGSSVPVSGLPEGTWHWPEEA